MFFRSPDHPITRSPDCSGVFRFCLFNYPITHLPNPRAPPPRHSPHSIAVIPIWRGFHRNRCSCGTAPGSPTGPVLACWGGGAPGCGLSLPLRRLMADCCPEFVIPSAAEGSMHLSFPLPTAPSRSDLRSSALISGKEVLSVSSV